MIREQLLSVSPDLVLKDKTKEQIIIIRDTLIEKEKEFKHDMHVMAVIQRYQKLIEIKLSSEN